MKPLILHAPTKAINQKRKQITHFEFCNQKLANGLKWMERWNLYK